MEIVIYIYLPNLIEIG